MSATPVWSRGHEWFLETLSKSKSRVLVTDYDGTIAPFSSDRPRARPYPAVAPLLRQIMETCLTRVIVVSGRAARDIPSLLGIQPPPEIWGSHGVEKLYPDGRYEEMDVSEAALQALGEAELKLDEESLGRHLEVKLAAIAVHWRALAPAEVLRIRTRAYRILEPIAARDDLILAEFDEGVELRLRSGNKGEALHSLLGKLDGSTPVAYLGDDVDDEDAFRVLNGRGLSVLVKPRAQFTAAQVIVRPPEGLIAFLTDWIHACGKKA